jgi:hypothetical protein
MFALSLIPLCDTGRSAAKILYDFMTPIVTLSYRNEWKEARDRQFPVHELSAVNGTVYDLSTERQLTRRALAIDEASFGPDHPRVAIDLNNLAQLLQATNRLSDAEPLSRRHLEIFLSIYRRYPPRTSSPERGHCELLSVA